MLRERAHLATRRFARMKDYNSANAGQASQRRAPVGLLIAPPAYRASFPEACCRPPESYTRDENNDRRAERPFEMRPNNQPRFELAEPHFALC